MDKGSSSPAPRKIKRNPHILMIFLDGVGIGGNDKKRNPFYSAGIPVFKKLFGGKIPVRGDSGGTCAHASFTSLDATLGVRGLPQSATGQTALLTGVNGARIIGKHFGPYIYSELKPVVGERNIFRQLGEIGSTSYYANAFPRQYFEYVSSGKRTTVITYAWLSAGRTLNDYGSLKKKRSLSPDITNERWRGLGYPEIPIITPFEGGRRLASIAREFDFVFYEYFYTDQAGHSRSMTEAVRVLERVDTLLEGIISSFDRERMLLIVTSDHGNLEDLSVREHTRNPVPFVAYGRDHKILTESVKELTDVTPAVVGLMSQ